MSTFNLRAYNQLVRFFEKQAELIGLSKNAGPVLATLYLSKYVTSDKISLEDLADSTSYSRSNVSLILNQLEALGIAFGEIDFSQTGRGRRRILYAIDDRFTSLTSLVAKTTIMQLQETIKDIEQLKKLDENGSKKIDNMLDDLQREAETALKPFVHTSIYK